MTQLLFIIHGIIHNQTPYCWIAMGFFIGHLLLDWLLLLYLVIGIIALAYNDDPDFAIIANWLRDNETGQIVFGLLSASLFLFFPC